VIQETVKNCEKRTKIRGG